MPSSGERDSIITPFVVASSLAALTLGMVTLRQRGVETGWLLLGLSTAIVVQLTLVSVFSMHLRWDGRLLGAMLVPVGLLAIVLILCLLPDGLFASWQEMQERAIYSAQLTEALTP
ncbi:MAG: hypothetical protein SNJ75_11440 [Gemmataceae bacterium]